MGVAGLRVQQALRSLDYGRPSSTCKPKSRSFASRASAPSTGRFLTGQIVWWIPFVVVVFAALTGVNLYQSRDFVTFAAWNIAGGLAFIPLALWIARRHGDRLSKVKAVRYFADSIAGRDIAAAREFIEKLRRFDSGAA